MIFNHMNLVHVYLWWIAIRPFTIFISSIWYCCQWRRFCIMMKKPNEPTPRFVKTYSPFLVPKQHLCALAQNCHQVDGQTLSGCSCTANSCFWLEKSWTNHILQHVLNTCYAQGALLDAAQLTHIRIMSEKAKALDGAPHCRCQRSLPFNMQTSLFLIDKRVQ